MRRIAFVLAALAVLAGCGGGDDGNAVATSDMAFQRFDGTSATVADYEGEPVLINFFSTTCVPCVTEMPAFERLHQSLGDRVTFLGLNVQDTVEDGLELVEDTGVTWELGRDPVGELLRQLGGIGLPTTVLISADGRVVEVHTGELSEDEARDLVEEKLLA